MLDVRVSELPRLLFCCFDVVPAPHATSRRLTEYLKGLSEAYQVVALTVKTPDHSHIERYQGARLLRVPVGSGDLKSRMEAFDRAVRRQLESEEYLVVHFFDPVSGYPLCERRGDFGYKLVYDATRFPSGDLPSLLPQEGSNKRLLAKSRRQELFCLMNADAVIVGSEAAKAHCVSLGVTASHVSVLRAPVDLAPFSPELMGVPDGTPARLIHLGSHGRHQDLPLLFEALSKTKSQVKLALVGPTSTELTPALKDQVLALGLSERVEFQEPVAHDDLHKVLAAADVGVVTLTDEPRNRTTTALARVGEFLAAGRPIIAADLPLTRELLPGDAVRFYKPGDVTSLAEAIDALADDPAQRKALGAAARAGTTPVDAHVIREQLVALYRRVAPTGDAPADAVEDQLGPADATQLGGRPPDESDVTQASARLPEHDTGRHDVGTNKVKTDPAVHATPEADTGTDQAAARERPPVMGVPLRESEHLAPPVAAESTDPAASPSGERVVMGLPINDRLPDADAVAQPAPREGPPVPDEPEVAAALEPEPRTEGFAALKPPEAPPPPPAEPPKPPSVLLSHDDEPLDFSNLLRPSAPINPPPSLIRNQPVPSPEITAPVPVAPAPRAPPPTPIQVPTSFSLPPRPTNPVPGATFVPVPLGVQVSTVPARVSVPAPAPASPPVSAPPVVVSVPAPPAPPPLPRSTGSGVRAAPPEAARPFSPIPTGSSAGTPRSPAVVAALTAPPTEAARPFSPIPTGSSAGTPRSPAVVAALSAPPVLASALAAPPALPPAPARPPPGVGVVLGTQIPAGSTPGSSRSPAVVAALAQPPVVTGRALAVDPTPTAAIDLPAHIAPPARTTSSEDVVEVREDEVELVNDEAIESVPEHEGPHEIDAHELHALETSAAPPPSRLDPWFAQLVHGYCPPESQLFTRHVPPTTMPGRDT